MDMPAAGDLGGWRVSYPFDGDVNEGGQRNGIALALTQFVSADTALGRVWDLSRNTILRASLDVNTDSNTRQRDV